MPRKPKPKRSVRVWWIDSAESEHGWVEPDDGTAFEKPLVTIGYVITETKASITIACTWDERNGHALNPTKIWKKAITKREYLDL